MMRTDAAIARLSELVCVAAGVKKAGGGTFRMIDFMPYMDAPEPAELTIDDFMRVLGSTS